MKIEIQQNEKWVNGNNRLFYYLLPRITRSNHVKLRIPLNQAENWWTDMRLRNFNGYSGLTGFTEMTRNNEFVYLSSTVW